MIRVLDFVFFTEFSKTKCSVICIWLKITFRIFGRSLLRYIFVICVPDSHKTLLLDLFTNY